MKSKYPQIIFVFILIASIFVPARAQKTDRSVRGKVVDGNGAAVTNATVKLRRPSGFVSREQQTDADGRFNFDQLSPEPLLLFVEAVGFIQTGGAHTVRLDQGPVAEMTIELSLSALQDGIVISETRTETRSSEALSSLFLATSADIDRKQKPSVLDILRSSPGISVMQTSRRGGQTSLFVRGGESDYTKVLIDGIPINDAGGAFDLADLTTDNAERIELIRGAQSAIYGSDAMSGVLQLITRRGTTTTPEFEISSEGGSFGFNRNWARLAGAAGAFDYSGSFSYMRTGGRVRNDDYLNRTGSLNVGYRFTDRTRLRLVGRSENASLGAPGPIARLYPDPDERALRRRLALGVKFDDQTSTYWNQTVTFTYAENNQAGIDPIAQDLTKPGTPPDNVFAFVDFASYFSNHQRRRGLRYQSDFILPAKNLLSAGFEFESENAVFNTGFDGRNRVAADRRNFGGFIQDQISLFKRWSVAAGLRIEHNRADVPTSFAAVLKQIGSAPYDGTVGFGTKLAPKVASSYVLRSSSGAAGLGQTRLRASYGEGIKAPTLIEAFSPSTFFLGNPALRPERARSFDVGLEQFLMGEKVRLELVFFENHYRDQIAFVGDPATFGGPVKLPDGRLTNYVNFDKARARGMELSFSARPVRQWSFGGSYTLLKSRQTAAADVVDFNTLTLVPNPEVGLRLLRRPVHSGSFNVAWSGDRLDADLSGYVVGERRDLDPITFSRLATNRGYTRVDVAGGYRLLRQLTLFARVENLLNRDYQEVLGFPAYRLNFSAGLKLKIGGRK